MSIKEEYKELTSKQLTLNDFPKILELKNKCKLEMNQEYLFLCDISIIDIYIDENLFDDALSITLKCLNSIDNIVFQKIYISLLERVIYIFIQKKNFKSAYRYAFMKRNFIDIENIDQINRWYLEMAYIYAELNQKDKALMNLKAILANYPNESLKALTLSNMTKLYIDQSMVEDAKKSLNECLSLVYKLNDEEGILYCEYLNAKLFVLEKNHKLAKQSFQEFFKHINTLTDDYLNIANEYIKLLIDMDLYDEAYRTSIKYLKSIEKSDDLYIKKDYYKNYLKIYILKNKNVRDDLRQLLQAIEVLEVEIVKYDENIINESNEDEKKLEVQMSMKTLINKVERILNLVNMSLQNDNERDCIMEYSKKIEEAISFNETLYVVFAKSNFEILPEFFDNINKVKTYHYKTKRLYERDYSFNSLNSTIVEMVISSNHEVIIDFADSQIPVKDLISGKTYPENDVKSLIAIPLYHEKEMIGCAIYTSTTNSLLDTEVMVQLRIASKLLELKLISLYNQEYLRGQKAILQVATTTLKEGLFYVDPLKQKLYFSNELMNFFQLENRYLSKQEYLDFINEDDKNIYQNTDKFIENVEPYHIEYRLHINEKEVLVQENASPYITREGVLKFYVGTITKLENAVAIDNSEASPILCEKEFNEFFNQLSLKSKNLEYKCTFAKFLVTNSHELSTNIKNEVMTYIYSIIIGQFSELTYSFKDDSYLSVLEISDQRVIDKKIKGVLNVLDQGIMFQDKPIDFDIRVSIVRYPRDTYNLSEVLEYCDIALSSDNRYQVFNDEIKKTYLKKRAVIGCINEQIKRDSLELLYVPLVSNNKTAYEVHYNINGLLPKEEIYEYLDKSIIYPFEKLVLKNLFKEISDKNALFYVHISCQTLDYLMKMDYFSKENVHYYQKVIFCIDDNCIYLEKILNYLHSFSFRVNINYRVVHKIQVGLLFHEAINGLFINDAIENREKVLSLCGSLHYEILANYLYPDYTNIIFREDQFISINDIK